MGNKTDRQFSTVKEVEAIRPPAGATERVDYWHSEIRGFGLRVSGSGARSWFVLRRLNGRLRRVTLGNAEDISLKDATRLAHKAISDLAQGNDPTAAKAAARAEETAKSKAVKDAKLNTVEKWSARYLKEDAAENKTVDQVRKRFDSAINPVIGHIPISQIDAKKIAALLATIKERAPFMANRVFANLHRFFNWLVEQREIAVSPMLGMKRPMRKELSRDRTLTEPEIVALLEALPSVAYPYQQIFHLLLLTGQRREEIGALRWSEIDIEKAEITLSRDRTKAERPHSIQLSTQALVIIKSLPKIKDQDLVFATSENTAPSNYGHQKAQLDAIMAPIFEKNAKRNGNGNEKFKDWRLHDLRRTAATGMAELGFPPHVVSRILNHSPGSTQGITAIYNRFHYRDEKRAALQAWANKVDAIMSPDASSNVVKLAVSK